MAAATTATNAQPMDLRASRGQLLQDSLGIMVSAGGFGLVYGLSAREAFFSPVEAGAMSVLVFAGAAQFAAVGYVAGGFSWLAIIALTAFLNARHLLYAAALAPYLSDRPRWVRAVMAHLLTDEAFALAIAHFRRIGRGDVPGYLIGAIVSTFIPWNIATFVGVTIGGSIPEPSRFGLDVIFPAAMGGLAVGLITGRRELVAAISGAILAVAIGLAWDPAAGIIAGGVLAPLVGMAVRPRGHEHAREGQLAFGPEPADDHDDGDAHEHALTYFPQKSSMPDATRTRTTDDDGPCPARGADGPRDLPVPRDPAPRPGLRAPAGASPALPAARRTVGAGRARRREHPGGPGRGGQPDLPRRHRVARRRALRGGRGDAAEPARGPRAGRDHRRGRRAVRVAPLPE